MVVINTDNNSGVEVEVNLPDTFDDRDAAANAEPTSYEEEEDGGGSFWSWSWRFWVWDSINQMTIVMAMAMLCLFILLGFTTNSLSATAVKNNMSSTSKATKASAKATKAPTSEPSLAPSASSAPSYKPSSSPTDTVCPCFVEDDLAAVTSTNVDITKSSCVGPKFVLTTATESPLFLVETVEGVPFCFNTDSAVGKQITTVEEGVCINLIINRCTQIGLPTE